jgi:tetratricopeptide (TPR) repeat protein
MSSFVFVGSVITSLFFPPCGLTQDAEQQPALPTPQDIIALKRQVEDTPQDAKGHFAYAHALRLTGRNEQAAVEYLEATALDPSLYVAYHELSLSKARPEQLDEAIHRLDLLKTQQPKVLMLRVALSELLEQRGQLYPAAKVLVDLVYDNAVPDKYLPKVKARIHYLLSKNKDAQTAEKINPIEAPQSEEAPLPLPESSLRRNLAATKPGNAKGAQSFGHASLLP